MRNRSIMSQRFKYIGMGIHNAREIMDEGYIYDVPRILDPKQ